MTVDQQRPDVPHNPEPDKPTHTARQNGCEWPTPGPWRTHRISSGIAIVSDFEDGPFQVCLVHDTNDPERDRANARLIAASPELLKVCNEARFVIHELSAQLLKANKTPSDAHLRQRAWEVVEHARFAINIASGGAI